MKTLFVVTLIGLAVIYGMSGMKATNAVEDAAKQRQTKIEKAIDG